MLYSTWLASGLALAGTALANCPPTDTKKPNIVFILSDDQDRLLGSPDFQPILHRDIVSKGAEFTNHFGTTAQCCPSRAGMLRGQFAHNTNITHVNGAG